MNVRALVLAAVSLFVATTIVAGGATAVQEPTRPAVVIDVNEDGEAAVLVRMTFDLSNDAERAAFRSLKSDSTTREAIRSSFRDRLEPVVAGAENRTGREMSIRDLSLDVSTTDDGSTGIVRLSVTWSGLAAQEGDRLKVREPFASGFTAERRVVLRAPDGYAITAVTPEPDQRSTTRVVWSAGTDLSGFEVVLEPDDNSAGETTTTPRSETTTAGGTTTAASETGGEDGASGGGQSTGGQPGFGVVAALVSLFVAAFGLKRRYH